MPSLISFTEGNWNLARVSLFPIIHSPINPIVPVGHLPVTLKKGWNVDDCGIKLTETSTVHMHLNVYLNTWI